MMLAVMLYFFIVALLANHEAWLIFSLINIIIALKETVFSISIFYCLALWHVAAVKGLPVHHP